MYLFSSILVYSSKLRKSIELIFVEENIISFAKKTRNFRELTRNFHEYTRNFRE